MIIGISQDLKSHFQLFNQTQNDDMFVDFVIGYLEQKKKKKNVFGDFLENID